MTRILNLTQHSPTPEQTAQGVVEMGEGARAVVRDLLTFTDLPSPDEVRRRAEGLAELASLEAERRGATAAMIGGAPYLMGPLERALRKRGITPLYAFSRRESVEEKQDDGSVRKVAVFRHLGFVEGCL